ncbi:hypothetical protein [Chlamydia sp. 17-3921]|uniref:hypothetical protein n=1 Tax=Chlamydia sp. 17-3921 TaxID=2675798 RepID=UPI00191AE503|nr:hypothetical protein [Chlamydia sp. 17-3921]
MRIVLAIFSLLLMLPIIAVGKLGGDEESDKQMRVISNLQINSEIFRSYPEGLKGALDSDRDIVFVVMSCCYSDAGYHFLVELAESLSNSMLGDIATVVLLCPSETSEHYLDTYQNDLMAKNVKEFRDEFSKEVFPEACLITIEVMEDGSGHIVDIASLMGENFFSSHT